MENMNIVHGKHYDAFLMENGKQVAAAGFYSHDFLDEAVELEQGASGLFLTIGLDIHKYRDYDNRNCCDFQEAYARKVAQMVYEMLLVQ